MSETSEIIDNEELADISEIGGDTNIEDLDDIMQLKLTVAEGKHK